MMIVLSHTRPLKKPHNTTDYKIYFQIDLGITGSQKVLQENPC